MSGKPDFFTWLVRQAENWVEGETCIRDGPPTGRHGLTPAQFVEWKWEREYADRLAALVKVLDA